jgi:heat-inducible transcriptional repressor
MDRAHSQVRPDDRARELLRLIVRTYIGSGEPVASRTLARLMQRSLSPATIRNIMADLETEGYLTHPHTSAGRVPTESAYRVYVDSLGASRPTRSAEAYINESLARAESIEDFMSTACCLLSDISRNVGIVISPPIESSRLRHIEFIRVDEEKITGALTREATSTSYCMPAGFSRPRRRRPCGCSPRRASTPSSR